MALEDIFRALEEQADSDMQAVLEEARAHAASIREEAQRDADSSRDARVAEAERVTRAKSSQALNSVRLEARKKLAGVKERAIRQVFEQAEQELGKVRGRKDYPDIFRAIASEALASVEGAYEVLVDPADAELAKTILSEMGSNAPVRAELSTAGGVVIATDDGRVMRRNTLEDRLGKLKGLAQADVAEIVFV